MKKFIITFIAAVCLMHSAMVSASEPVRVKCDRYTMNVPSANMKCYQVDTSIPVSETASPEEIANAQIANTAIYFSDFEALSSTIPPQVTFYRTEDMAKTSFDLGYTSMTISNLMNNITSGYRTVEDSAEEVPFMPYQVSQPLAAVLPQKIDFENGSGIRTVTVFQDTVYSSSGMSNIYYSFQGISADGNIYVSAVFPVRNGSLDGQQTASINWDSVVPADFSPSLEELDYYVRSIVIE